MTEPGWEQTVRSFEQARLAAGYAARSTQIQAQRLIRLTAPLDAAGRAVEAKVIDELAAAVIDADLNRESMRAGVQALVTFRRWLDAAQPSAVARPEPAVPLPAAWSDALLLFAAGQRADGVGPATIAQRLKHLRRLALDLDLSPWHVSHEQLRLWLEGLPCSETTRLAHRTSLRAFFRWAARSGRVQVDPSLEPSLRAQRLPVPDGWQVELSRYRSWLRAHGRPETTVRHRMEQLRTFARAHASRDPFELTLDDLVDWLANTKWAAETRRGYRSALRSFYRWAKEAGRTKRNVARKIPVVRGGQPRPRPVSETEYRTALANADPRERVALRLAAELGMRRSEVAVVHSRDLMVRDDAWSLLVHGKGDKERLLPLPFALQAMLAAQPEGWLLPNGRGGHLSPEHLGKLIGALLPEGVTMHALRHRFATRTYAIDRDVFTVQALLGHASPATTQSYVLVPDADLRRLVEAVQV